MTAGVFGSAAASGAWKSKLCAPLQRRQENGERDADHEAGEAAGEAHRRPRGARCPPAPDARAARLGPAPI